MCCRYLLLLAACVSRQLTTKRYRKCQGICFFALPHNSDPRSSCDSVSRASARSRRAQSWWCATAGSSQGGARHGKYLSTLRVQLCTLSSRGAVQSKPRWLSPPRTSRQCPHARRSRADDTGRVVLGPARAAHIPPATKGFTCTANCLADNNLLILSSPPSPSPSSRSRSPTHELQPAARRFDAIEL